MYTNVRVIIDNATKRYNATRGLSKCLHMKLELFIRQEIHSKTGTYLNMLQGATTWDEIEQTVTNALDSIGAYLGPLIDETIEDAEHNLKYEDPIGAVA